MQSCDKSTECFTIFSKHPDHPLRVIGVATPETHDKVCKIVKAERPEGLKILVSELFTQSNWKNLPHIEEQVLNSFHRISTLDIIKFKSFVRIKSSQGYLDDLFGCDIINFKDYLYNKLKTDSTDFISDYSEFGQVISDLWNIKFDIGAVFVGPGELCISLLTGCQKSRFGDLNYKQYEIELKSNYGRLGKSLFTHKFRENLLSSGIPIDVEKEYLNWNNIKLEILRSKILTQFAKKKSNYPLEHNLETSSFPVIMIDFQQIPNSKTLLQNINQYFNYRQDIKDIKDGVTRVKWLECVYTCLMYENNLTEEQFLKILSFTRTEQLDVDEELELLSGLRLLEKMYGIKQKLSIEKDRELLVFLIWAIQLTAYRAVTKFDFLFLVNPKTYEIAVFNTHKKSITECLISTFQFLYAKKDKFYAKLDVDDRNKGISISMK